MNEIVNKFLLAGQQFIPNLHVKQLGFTYSACGPIIKTTKELKNLCRPEMKTISSKMILIKSAFNI